MPKPFTPRPPTTAHALSAWEGRFGVRLPAEYRAFLLEVGDGATMPGDYCDFTISSLSSLRGGGHAAQPFPVTAARLHEKQAAGWPREGGVLFPELSPFWEDPQTDELPPGCVTLGGYPSGDLLLLVTAGDLRGTVWCGVDGGVPEMSPSGGPFGFAAWLSDALATLGA